MHNIDPYTDHCICAAERDDEVFCRVCRADHENLLSVALRLPNQAEPPVGPDSDPVPPPWDVLGAYRAAYGWARVELDDLTTMEQIAAEHSRIPAVL